MLVLEIEETDTDTESHGVKAHRHHGGGDGECDAGRDPDFEIPWFIYLRCNGVEICRLSDFQGLDASCEAPLTQPLIRH